MASERLDWLLTFGGWRKSCSADFGSGDLPVARHRRCLACARGPPKADRSRVLWRLRARHGVQNPASQTWPTKALVPRLADDCAGVRRRAAETLEQLLSGGGLGLEEVHAAAEALEKRIDDPDHWVRAASARALERGLLVDSAPLEADHRERLATAMAGRVQDRSRPVRRSVARALASRGTRQSADAAAVDAT